MKRAMIVGGLVLALGPGCDSAPTSEPAPAPEASAESESESESESVVPDRGEPGVPKPEAADAPQSQPQPDHQPEPKTQPQPQPQPQPQTGRPSLGHADLDPDNDDIIGPQPAIEGCHEQLEAAGLKFKPARIGVGRKRDGVYTCGAHQVVRIKRGPGKIKYSSYPMLTCQMALAWPDFERIVQEEAERELGSRVVKIEHMGTYNCRDMALYDLISEHSFANGIDLKRFHLANGKQVDVKKHFKPREVEPPTDESRFLRRLSQRLYDEDVFSNVITPYFDRVHHNHIHVDLARYRVDGTRP